MTTESTRAHLANPPSSLTIPLVYGTASIPLDPKDSETEH